MREKRGWRHIRRISLQEGTVRKEHRAFKASISPINVHRGSAGGKIVFVSGSRTILVGVLAMAACSCSGSSAAPSYPDLTGTYTGHVVIGIALPNVPGGGTVCTHQWTIGSSVGGQITGTWQSTPETDLQHAVPACQQSGSLSGTVSSSGALNLSFNAVLGVTGCTTDGGGDVLSGAEALGAISASGQDTIHCPGVLSEPRTLTFSLYKLQ